MKTEHLLILQHTLGLDRFGRGNSYRNHFVTGEDCIDYPDCMEMVTLGYMTRRAGTEISGGYFIFQVTDVGRLAVADNSPAPPVQSRSQRRYARFLQADSGMSFGQWLKSGWSKLTERRA